MDHVENFDLGNTAFDGNNEEKKSWACSGHTFSRSVVVFLSQLFNTSLFFFGCSWRLHLSTVVTSQLLEWKFCVV